MPFLAPQKKALKSQLNSLFGTIFETFQTFSDYLIDFSRPFLGGQKWYFSDFEMHFSDFQDFGSCMGPGGRKDCEVMDSSDKTLQIRLQSLG